jgi:hypothetical protein
MHFALDVEGAIEGLLMTLNLAEDRRPMTDDQE